MPKPLPLLSAALTLLTIVPAVHAQIPTSSPTPTPSANLTDAANPANPAKFRREGDAPSPTPLPKTAIPASTHRHNPSYKICERRIAALQGKPVDILFMGDSLMQHWDFEGKDVWKRYYADRNALNFGVGVDKTQDVLWRLDTMNIRQFKPRVAVLLIGTNNDRDTAPDIAAGIAAIIHRTQQIFPGIRIILVSIIPSAHANDLLQQTNTLIRRLADDRTVYYLDLAALMTPQGKSWKGLSRDRVHPSPLGYQMWAEAMEPLLARLLADPQKTEL